MNFWIHHLTCAALLMFAPAAWSAGAGGGHSLGGGLGFITPGQSDTNTLISRANTRAGGITASSLSSAYELTGFYQYRFSGTMFAVQFRPSYFYQSSSGTGGTEGSGYDGKYSYTLQGFTVFPALRIYPLESSFMRFFMQFGIGYGRLSGTFQEAGASVSFAGGAFGTLVGMGAEFCFTDNHCLNIEGNLRYLPIERNISSSSSGTFASDSLTQYGSDQEVEFSNQDLKTSMSGVQGIVAYAYKF